MKDRHSVYSQIDSDESKEEIPQISPIADTISGIMAREDPNGTIIYYEGLASRLWLPPKVREVVDALLDSVHQGRNAWGSLSGPYGFGKTAAAIALWNHARCEGFLAIPPLSCTNFDELAYGIATLAKAQAPKIEKQIQKIFDGIWTEGLNQVIRTDAKRYEMAPQKVRQILEDKLNAGQLTLDSHSYRLVELLSKLGQIATEQRIYKGFVIILDELQQLLGPLDARAIVRFREFVWGMRTEHSHCGVILALDTLLEARLARWAADVLHRIRENGQFLQLSNVYTREFPVWLWDKLVNNSGLEKLQIDSAALTQDVLLSLGQLVERSDLANGPRTVVDVFLRAIQQYKKTGVSYDIPNLVEDVHQGRFRYFGEGATIQRVLIQILSDDWISQDSVRETLIRVLAAFPLGCPQSTLQRFIPDEARFEKSKMELYGPLLVSLPDGLALEQLQHVRRSSTNWEQILSRCWETLPALDSLAAHAPDMIARILVPRLFPKGNPANPMWEQVSDDSSALLTGWHILKGTFDEAYPQREVALCVTDKEPETWLQNVDICIALVCDNSIDASPSALSLNHEQVNAVLIKMPILKSLNEHLPAELKRYHKYIQPEPFRPVIILAALHELESFLNVLNDDISDAERVNLEKQYEIRRVSAFVNIVVDFITRELLVGSVNVGIDHPIKLCGPELLRALFTMACHRRYPQYQTLVKGQNWRKTLSTYRMGIRSDRLNILQRQGRESVIMPKAEMLKVLFGQTSTAAGDSLLRILGPLVETSGDAKLFSLRMAMHPGEVSFLNYLKGLKSKHSIPFEAGVEFLQHQGFIRDETEEIAELLIDRELLTRDRNNGIHVIQNDSVERELLVEKISEVHSKLRRLGAAEGISSIAQNASVKELQGLLDILEERLKSYVKEQFKELEGGMDALREMIGTVRAATILADWPDSELSTHLTGVAAKLQQAKESILGTLRRGLKQAEKELNSSSTVDEEWAFAWMGKRDSFFRDWQKQRERVSQFDERMTALALWVPQNSRLRSTRDLCAKIHDADPGPAQVLNRLVDDFRERFATDSWEPVFASSEFSEKLHIIQAEVQELLYSYVQTFNQELEELKNQFKNLLPTKPPPVFNVSEESDERYNSISESFQQLYHWALEGFRSVATDCRHRRQNGAIWRHPTNMRTNWVELDNQVEVLLRDSSGILDFSMVQNIGTSIEKMLLGFASTYREEKHINLNLEPELYDDPASPPDFKKLEELYLKGQITIRVDPKSLGQ